MHIDRLRTLVTDGKYSLGPHALRHAQEDGFEKEHCLGALLDGRVLENYPRERRCLVLGRYYVTLAARVPLHVVCDYTNDREVRIVTAYIPKAPEWESPTLRMRKVRLR